MNELQNIDMASTLEAGSPREAAIQQALLQLLQQYPEADKYLGPAALAHLQKMQVVDPQVVAKRNALMSVLQGLSNAQ